MGRKLRCEGCPGASFTERLQTPPGFQAPDCLGILSLSGAEIAVDLNSGEVSQQPLAGQDFCIRDGAELLTVLGLDVEGFLQQDPDQGQYPAQPPYAV